ncbi:pyrimidine utilization protein A [Cladophialophora immunda]|uniref:Pyrimidine utilization protein A n=1 Tax=Cladophialophora immunda TaxID=569365 RepID=A0A0D2D709_9EURO|nr:pyrimidine utilization protein A [Cladophialophora immunda]KIW31474.1 pyrimidine utilization protein A [Cladophialophora immunda]
MVKPLEIGIFIPIGNDGWLISTNAPHYKPTYELNRDVVLKAESYGFDFALSMIKLRGYGGVTEHWDYNLESFTLMAGIAPLTKRIKLFASSAILTLPPAIVARMAVTIENMCPGRFGVNIVTGWQAAEYEQMGLWPGNEYFGYRYDYAEEYVKVMQELWEKGSSDLKGKYFTMNDCRLLPKPSTKIPIIAAGQSDRGTKFASEFADYNFTIAVGINTPTAFRESNQRLVDAAKATGRDVGSMILMMVIADETNEKAQSKWDHYCAGTDEGALEWAAKQMARDEKADARSTAGIIVSSTGHKVNTKQGVLVGSYEVVASQLDEISEVEGVKGVMLIFDEFLQGLDNFAKYIQPRMKSRAKVNGASLDGSAFLVGLFAGVLLNRLGPAVCISVGAMGYPIYVGGYWYFGENGRLVFPIAGAVILGMTANLINAAVGYIAISYSEERYKGFYVCWMQVIIYTCSMVASIIPLAIDANDPSADRVPTAVYGTFVALMCCAVILGVFVLPAEKIKRSDGTDIARIPPMTFMAAIRGSIKCFKDWRLLLLVPGMMSSEIHLVYLGVANGWQNNSRVRALDSFVALFLSIPINLFLSWLLDNKRWTRKTRAFVGTGFVGIFLLGSFIAEMVIVSKWHRHGVAPQLDWDSDGFAGQLILFIIAWNAGGLVLNLVTWYLGAMSNDPLLCANYTGLLRCLISAGQGMMFGIDASAVPFVNEAGAMFGMFAMSILGMLAFATFCLEETRYFKEEHVIVPFYAQEQLHGEEPPTVEVVQPDDYTYNYPKGATS